MLQWAFVTILESSEKLESLNKEREDVKKNQIEILELKTDTIIEILKLTGWV